MSSLRSSLKNALPSWAWEAARESRDTLARLPELPAAMFHPLRRASISRLAALKNIHLGERCFIIGNGPSLNNTDLSLLKDEYSFGMNRIYLLFPKLGFSTTYFLSVNSLVIEQCADDIRQMSIPCFLPWRARDLIQPSDQTIFLYTTYTSPRFATNAASRLWEGATVTYVAMQLAFHMGFRQVILIGVDHNFVTQGKPNTEVVSSGDDPNHFSPAYFGKGFRWQLPDLETSERAYCMARDTYRHYGREIIDATVGGKLTVFPKVEFTSLFS